MRSNSRSGAIVAIALAAGLLCLQPARADILKNFADSVAAQAAAAKADTDLRPIPENARAGVMLPPRGRLVAIDNTAMKLSPGSKIRDLRNRIVLPSTITKPVNVRYTLDPHFLVHRIWLMGGEVELGQKEKSTSGDN